MFSKLKFLAVLVVTLVTGFAPSLFSYRLASASTFQPSMIMSDRVFDNSTSMLAASIDSFLNTFPNSCISTAAGFSSQDVIGYNPTQGFLYSTDSNGAPINVSAGTVIAHAAEAYTINPQVLIAMMQEQEGVVSGSGPYGCSTLAISASEGYGCPDGGTTYNYSGVDLYNTKGTEINSISGICVSHIQQVGFSQQVIHAAWLLKFGEQRSEGNYSWNVQLNTTTDNSNNAWVSSWNNSDDPLSCYGGPMTQGNWYNCPPGANPSPPPYWDGYSTIDSTSVYMGSGPTSSFYWYTPHFPGNQGFYNIFTGWFGTTGCPSTLTVPKFGIILSEIKSSQTLDPNLVIESGSNSGCVEFNQWNTWFSTWETHATSGQSGIDPANSLVTMADIYGNGYPDFIIIGLAHTPSGMVEFHVWDPVRNAWVANIASNQPCVDPANSTVEFADVNGNGHAVPILVGLNHTPSGMVEFHVWNSNMTSFGYQTASNQPVVDPANSKVVFGDPSGNGKDVPILVGLNHTPSGMIEFHVWNSNMTSFGYQTASNQPVVDPANTDIQFADFNKNGRDVPILIGERYTGSHMVEFQVWNPDMTSWQAHIVSNQPELN